MSPDFPTGYDHSGGPRDTSKHFVTSAEDAAHEFERSVLGDDLPSSALVPTRPKVKGKAAKRPASGAVSDANSDLEVPQKSERIGPAAKKRKLDKVPATTAEDVASAVNPVSISAMAKIAGSSKGKGKGKQAVREFSHDSISVTPKPSRKKPGPKKKLGLALELELEIASASHPPSISGDVTPVGVSRPTSPVQANATFVYELDESIPPLKKAKKIDDTAMVKRVKSLEEAQRKVWTNIAKRDVAKVCILMNCID